MINKFDVSLKVNDDLKNNITELYKENHHLTTSLEKEKWLRRANFEDSLHSEETADKEIRTLKLVQLLSWRKAKLVFMPI